MDIETDVDTFLAGEADRLRVIATALRGLAGDTGGKEAEAKVLRAAAGELDEIARWLDATRVKLCQRCRVLGIEKRVRVG
ncbi:MAG: hypothetical protein HY716_01790 [Planctomycetes bacterium]|nr:hypothetical protein [Planctomycetota bacterium]